MKYMISWKIAPGHPHAAAEGFLKSGAPMPDGLALIGCWHESESACGWVLVEGKDPKALNQHIAGGADRIEFEITPVIEDAKAPQALSTQKAQHDSVATTGAPLLCAVRGNGHTLKFAIEEARATNRPLYLLFIREQPVLAPEDRSRTWQEDFEAVKIFTEAGELAHGHTVLPCYAVSDSPANTIVDVAVSVGASRLILGGPKRSGFIGTLRGDLILRVSQLLPEQIPLLIV